MDEARAPLSRHELAALMSIDDQFVDADYWEDETIRLYRSLGLVWSNGKRISLTQVGMRATRTASFLRQQSGPTGHASRARG